MTARSRGAPTRAVKRRGRRESCTLLAYFIDSDDAESAYRRLRGRGAGGLALLSKDAINLRGARESPRNELNGVRSKRGFDDSAHRGFARTLVPGESVIVLRSRSASLPSIIDILRGEADTAPSLFLLHDSQADARETTRKASATLSLGQVKEHAESLAAEHHIDRSARRSDALFSCLEAADRRVHDACFELSDANAIQEGIPPVAEWLLDNEFIIGSGYRDILSSLPRPREARLPTISSGKAAGLPRVLDLARELIASYELRIDLDSICYFLDAYQSKSPLSIGELWALPQMLRLTLIESVADIADRAVTELRERERADFWADRLMRATRSGPDQLFDMLARLAFAFPEPSAYFGAQLVSHLYDEDRVLVLVQAWLERYFRQPLGELGLGERNRQAKDQVSIGNAFTSLRNLTLFDWKLVFERESQVELLLRGEASGTYPRMDFATRDRYRREIEGLSRSSGLPEREVAARTLELADRATGQAALEDERRTHVGYYLIGDGRPDLIHALGCDETRRARSLQWVYGHPAAMFFSTLCLISLGAVLLLVAGALRAQGPWARLLLGLLAALPASQLALELMGYLAARVLPARILPKMDYSDSGIPDRFRTLVVVPVMLGDAEGIRDEVERLEVRYLANKESNLLYGLFADYRDSSAKRLSGDAQLLEVMVQGIESLRQRYGPDRFFLFFRERAWSESEGAYIGWERKRGKLEAAQCPHCRKKDAWRAGHRARRRS